MLKIINSMALAIILVAGLSSCEMKDEILGKDLMSGDTGLLSLNVETGKASRGTTDQVDQFPVVITGIDVDYTKKFDSYADLQAEGEVTLPVGTYTVEACSPGEFLSTMNKPFYGGKLENVKVEKGQTSEISVVCTMQNVKISIDLTEEFLATYDDWEFNVTDKKGHIETYTKSEEGDKPAPVYWKMDESIEIIYINGTAKTKGNENETVTISGTARKSNLPDFEEGDDTSFIGGDELKIEFTPVKVEGSTPGILEEGIQITITMFNSEKNENVEIPVNPGTGGDNTEEPGAGEDGGDGEGDTNTTPTIQLPADITYSISAEDAPESADAIIKAPAGLESVIVKIDGGNAAFRAIINDLDLGGSNFTSGVDLVGNKTFEGIIADLGAMGIDPISVPEKGDTEYIFPIASFFKMLNIYKATDPGDSHDFIITVQDKNGENVEDVLKVTINE